MTSATQNLGENTGIKTTTNKVLPDIPNTKMAKKSPKTPHVGEETTLTSGSAGNVKKKTITITNTELPEGESSKGAKNLSEMPNTKDVNGIKSGSTDDEHKTTSKTTPDNQRVERDKNHQETPQLRTDNTVESNDTDEQGPESAKIVHETPKRKKYKTEVEKLIEMQSGLEVRSRTRSEVVAVKLTEASEPESIEAQIEGDGPKTGLGK
jgi:hypothetical protein